MYVKYSKKSDQYMAANASFFTSNQALLNKALADNAVYAAQPFRHCKLCSSSLDGELDFISHNVGYKFCKVCGHLNGVHDDTECYAKHLYEGNDGGNYAHYMTEQFKVRVESIYKPKVEFLCEALAATERQPDLDGLEILDVGCGAGHFVYACLDKGIAASGVDVNLRSVTLGNEYIGSAFPGMAALKHTSSDDFYSRIVASKANVLSAIGVIEHLQNPHKLFEAFQLSRIKYLLFLVPMYSASAIFESLFQNTYPRLLSGGHTHLFTNQSLDWLLRTKNLNSIAQWRFGADAMDLYRAILVSLRASGSSEKHLEMVQGLIQNEIDNIQAVFDKAHICSEVHYLVAKQ